MPNGVGKFVWYELMTSDTATAASFYAKIIGWTANDSGLPDRAYTILSMGPSMVGGLMPVPEAARAMGAQPAWMGYIDVDNVEECAARLKAAGGTLHRVPEDITGVGRFAVVSDPQGAGFIIFKGIGEQDPRPATPGMPGHIGWHELHAASVESAFAFYSDLFGWTRAEAVDMGPLGLYQTFATGATPVGGIMAKTPGTARPFWLYYINVEGVDAALARVKEGGGKLVAGPHQVPGGNWIARCLDPQGVLFALVSSQR